MPAYASIADAIAAKFAPASLPATPSGAKRPHSSTADLPNHIAQLPAFLVFLDRFELEQGNGTRLGGTDWLVRLYYGQAGGRGDLERDSGQLKDWLQVLVDQLQAGATLAGVVTVARIVGGSIGLMAYAGADYTGLELRVHTVSTEPFTVTA